MTRRVLRIVGLAIFGIGVLAIYAFVLANLISDRMSKQLDSVDTTYEEMLEVRR